MSAEDSAFYHAPQRKESRRSLVASNVKEIDDLWPSNDDGAAQQHDASEQDDIAQQLKQRLEEEQRQAEEDARRDAEQEAIRRAEAEAHEQSRLKAEREAKARADQENKRRAEEELLALARAEAERRAEEDARQHELDEKNAALAKQRAAEQKAHEQQHQADEAERVRLETEAVRRASLDDHNVLHPRPPNQLKSPDTHRPHHMRHLGPIDVHSKISTRDEVVEMLEVELRARRVQQRNLEAERERRRQAIEQMQQQEAELRAMEQRQQDEELRQQRLLDIEQRRAKVSEYERLRQERISKLRVDPDIVAGRRKLTDLIDERKQKLHEEEKAMREAKLKEHRQRFTTGPDYYESLKQHEQKVDEMRDAQLKMNTEKREHSPTPPQPSTYDTRYHRKILEELKVENATAQLDADVVKQRRAKQNNYADNVRTSMMPKSQSPFVIAEQVHTTPRDTMTPAERYAAGNKNLADGVPHGSSPKAEDSKEATLLSTVTDKAREIGKEYLKQVHEYVETHPKKKEKSRSVVEKELRVAAKNAVDAVEKAHKEAEQSRTERRMRQAALNREAALQKRKSTFRLKRQQSNVKKSQADEGHPSAAGVAAS